MNETILIKCPACSNEFPLSDAVLASVRDDLARELQSEINSREKRLSERQRSAEEKETAVAKREAEFSENVEAAVSARVKEQLGLVKSKATQKAVEENETLVRELQSELQQKTEALKAGQKQELQLRREKRELLEAKENLQLELQRKLDEERSKLREQIEAKCAEENRFKLAEKEKLIGDLREKLEEAQRKANQGSQQAQGEVLELDFEQHLQKAFPHDQVKQVCKGIRGADVSQEVISSIGKSCGVILYETKRTRSWSDSWIPKLKEDMRAAHAEIGVIVTETLPKDIDLFGPKDGIWVADLCSAVPLAHVLRSTMLEIALARGDREGVQGKMELLYAYLTGPEFRQRVLAVIESFQALREDLDRERRTLTRSWSKREQHINSVMENMAGMIGDVQGISGKALKDISVHELELSTAE